MYQWLQRLFLSKAPLGASPAAQLAEPAPPVAAAAVMGPAPRPSRAPHAPMTGVSFEQLDRVNACYLNWLFDAGPHSDLETSALEIQVLETLTGIINSQQSGSALVRRMPGLIPQLLQSLRRENFSGAQLSRTISSDVVLVATVIRLANSSFQGRGTTINSVEHAVMLIGQEGLRHLITSVAFRPIIDLNSGHFTRTLAPRIWDQSERCAGANRLLSEAVGIDPFDAFLAGLVLNVGLIVSLRIMDQMAKDDPRLGSEIFCARLVRDARILACSIGREWNFPASVTLAVSEQAGMKKGSVVSPLGRLLTLTDYLTKIRILADHGRLAESDQFLFSGLPAEAAGCYRSLDPIGEQ